jgi:hypothetical protein
MLICMARESGIETPTADPPLEDCPRQWLMYDIDNYAIPPV